MACTATLITMLPRMAAVHTMIHCLYLSTTGGFAASRASAFCQPR
jgi:hypothetical protein